VWRKRQRGEGWLRGLPAHKRGLAPALPPSNMGMEVSVAAVPCRVPDHGGRGLAPGAACPGASDDQMLLKRVTHSLSCAVGVEIVFVEIVVVTVVEVGLVEVIIRVKNIAV
jgi:hypothetical protein